MPFHRVGMYRNVFSQCDEIGRHTGGGLRLRQNLRIEQGKRIRVHVMPLHPGGQHFYREQRTRLFAPFVEIRGKAANIKRVLVKGK